MAVVKKFGDDQGGQPGGADRLLRVLLAVPAAARVRDGPRLRAAGRPAARRSRSSDSVLGQFPIIGEQLQAPQLHGHAIALVIGLVDLAVGRPRRHAGGPERVRPRLGGPVQGPARTSSSPGCAGSRCWSSLGRACSCRDARLRAGHRRPRRRRWLKVAGIAALAAAQLRPVRRRLPAADRGRAVADRAACGSGSSWPACCGRSSRSSAATTSATWSAREQHLRHLRARDRAAGVAAPRRAGDALRGRDQRRGRPQAVAAQPVRARPAPRPTSGR